MYLFVFISTNKYVKYFSGTNKIYLWKSNGISEESIKNIITSNSNFLPALIDYYQLAVAKFVGNCLMNNND